MLACLLSVQRSRTGDRRGALDLLTWVAQRADPGGGLPEQVPPRLAPERLAEWEHGAFLTVVAALPADP